MGKDKKVKNKKIEKEKRMKKIKVEGKEKKRKVGEEKKLVLVMNCSYDRERESHQEKIKKKRRKDT